MIESAPAPSLIALIPLTAPVTEPAVMVRSAPPATTVARTPSPRVPVTAPVASIATEPPPPWVTATPWVPPRTEPTATLTPVTPRPVRTSTPESLAPLIAPDAETETLPTPSLLTLTPASPADTDAAWIDTPAPLASLETAIPALPAVIDPVTAISTDPPPEPITLNASPVALTAWPPADCANTIPAPPDCASAKAVPNVSTLVPRCSDTDRAAAPLEERLCVPPTVSAPLQVNAPGVPGTGLHLLVKNLARSKVFPVLSLKTSL